MAVTSPDWLARRGGNVERGPDGRSFVVFAGKPQYRLTPVPVGGQFGCAIVQTINGRRVDSTARAGAADDAIRGGLEDLRKFLGW